MPANASLERALAETLDSDMPLPVVDAAGELKGVVSREELRRVFATADDGQRVGSQLAAPTPAAPPAS